MLSTRADLLPPAFIRQIQDLTDQVPASDWNDIKEVLEQEWGGSIDQFVHSIEPKTIASASIGEVYKGILKNGSKVAIKVQRPHIGSIVRTDFHILRIVVWIVKHLALVPKSFIDLRVVAKEVMQVIGRELDFINEQQNLLTFKDRYKDDDFVMIPEVYPELCTKKVLVMDWVEGIRITDEKALAQLPIVRRELAQRLLSIFLSQWLEAGLFHADPHPGNVLVSKDGKIILIDFGMMGHLSKKDATLFQGLIESFLAKNYPKVVEYLMDLGILFAINDSRALENLLAELRAFQPDQLQQTDMLSLKKEMNEHIQNFPFQIPIRFIFLGRSVITIEGILHELVPDEELMTLGKPVFIRWLSKQSENKWSFLWHWIQSQPMYKMVHSITEFLETPKRLERLKKVEQRRHFEFTIYENQKKRYYQLLLISVIGIILGLSIPLPILWELSIILFAVSVFGYSRCTVRQKKWLKFMQECRR
ncbi:AarF/ABC1/UbiB kinase family protein [Sporosarcina sp. HYO08]|uniref:ABC1 kinase family protein n=1 Tax=Sporosarcina sp. HYO08 TaxID=1759557 RepID=UPI0020A51B95|nr:AarF/ABC1/UbiB kinase family protein [Sporosarcina sp. HYO08]